MFVRSEGGGVRREEVEEEKGKSAALTDEQAGEIARVLVRLEEAMGRPQDFEWGIEEGEWGGREGGCVWGEEGERVSGEGGGCKGVEGEWGGREGGREGVCVGRREGVCVGRRERG